MLTSVEVLNAAGQTLVLELGSVSDGIEVRGISGLGPVKASVSHAPFAERSGTHFYGARREARNVVLSLGLRPVFGSKTVEDVRRGLYAFFAPPNQVTLKLSLNGVVLGSLYGVVESAEPNIFSKDPEMTVSILCFDPDIESTITYLTTGLVTSGASYSKTFTVGGELPVGVYLQIVPQSALTAAFTISHYGPPSNVTTILSRSYAAYNSIIMDTRNGQARLYLDAGSETSLLNQVSNFPKWFLLSPGSNTVTVTSTSASPSSVVIGYSQRYGGI